MDPFETLKLVYQWSKGSLPPPGHYEYHIEIGQYAGIITFIPDYPGNDTPVWVENFECATEALAQLYVKLDSTRFMTRHWGARDPQRVGGSTQSLDINIQGKSVHISYDLTIHEQEKLQPVFDAVKQLVPHPIWERLFALREVYIHEHYG